jgi:hypothetical protein
MGGSSSKQVATNIINSMVATVFTTVALTCSNNAESVQNISVYCNPPLDASVPPDQQEPWENQPACKTCIANVVEQKKTFYDLQANSWRFGKVAVNLPIDEDFTTVLKQMIACGTICKACVYQDLSQATFIQNLLECKSMLSIQNSINQKLTNAITQQLTNNSDFLAPISQMLGASSMQQIVANLTNRIAVKITNEVITGVLNTIENNQTMVLTGSSTDVKVQTQDSSFNCMVKYFQDTSLFSTIFSDEQWQVLEQLYNDQNTIGDLGNAVVRSLNDITRFISSDVGKVVIAMLVLVAIVFLGVVILGLSLYIRKKVAEQKAKELLLEDRSL